jgi:flagellar assembly protein FliH
MSATRHWRPHRFAPLSELTGTPEWHAGVPVHLSAQLQASIAEGFQRGMERGYREGHESGRQAGYETGLAEGRVQGARTGAEEARREVRERFERLAEPVDSIIRSLRALQDDYHRALRSEVVELVARVAREVIRCELMLQPAQLLALIDETVGTMPPLPGERIDVFLNPQDLERIREIDPERANQWHLVPDVRLETGECLVRVGEREADAGCLQRLERCMEQVKQQLLPDEGITEAAA